MYLNVEIIPTEPLYAQIIEMNRHVQSFATSVYNPDGDFCPPHLTLYSLCIPDNNLPELVRRIDKLSASEQSGTISITSLTTFLNGTIILACAPNNYLYQLHDHVVSGVNDLREGYMDPIYTDPGRLSSVQLRMLNQFGDPFVMEGFHPHIAIAKILSKDNPLDDIVTQLRDIPLTSQFTASSINIRAWKQAGESGRQIANLKMADK